MVILDTSIRSPNHSSRLGHPIRGIVVHATAGSARSALSWLTNPAARVSAHTVIDKEGRIFELVADERCAWHAGRSAWRGETQINELTLGVELANLNTGRDPYPPAQVAALLAWCAAKVALYQIAPEWVIRHLDCAVPRGRKSDPAGFDWAGFRARLFTPATHPPGTYRARTKVYARALPSRRGPFTTLPGGTVLLALDIVEGEFVRNTWGASNLWLKAAQGYVWLPQLEAL